MNATSSFAKLAKAKRQAENYQPKDKMPRGMHNQGDWYADQQADPYSGSHYLDQYRPDDSRM